jgi:CMP-N-acetylneuraminic acid synthetase
MTARDYLAIVPARGGSKRIPGKNLALLAGRPLIDYTLEAARSASALTAIVVSTDNPLIAHRAEQQGALVPALRPSEMAQDSSPVVDALKHALLAFEDIDSRRAQAIVLLQPTSPLRTSADIDAAIDLFEAQHADTVTSVRLARDHPYYSWRQVAGAIVPFIGYREMGLDRQELPPLYAENGAVYVIRRELVLEGRIYGDRVVPYCMDESSSIDIDSPLDLAWAEFLFARQRRP